MGLLESIFGRRTPRTDPGQSYETLTAYRPVFTSWNGRIYESDLVRAAIEANARHIGKLSYRIDGTARPRLTTATRSEPNSWYTWPQFLERCSRIYDVENNLFIVPILDDFGEPTGFFPVVPSSCTVVQDASKPYLKFSFPNGQTRCVPLETVGIVTKHQLRDDFFGDDNRALSPTMELIHIVNQGIEEGVKNCATFRFMARLNNVAFDEDLRKERRRFNKNNFQDDDGGLLLFGNQMSDIRQIDSKPYNVDPKQMEIIQKNVFQYFGTNEKILQNTANGDELDAFYNGCVEPFAIKLSEAMTRIVFTVRERNGGNRIIFTSNRLQYMSVASKISMAKELGDRGVLMIDEIRELFNYAPLPDGVGQHAPIRGEYYMVDEGNDDDADGGGTGADSDDGGGEDE